MSLAVQETGGVREGENPQIPNFREFKAWINLLPGTRTKLIVTGAVETHERNRKPVLTRAPEQGADEKVLLLDMEIVRQGDMGGHAFQYWPARYEEAAVADQFRKIVLRWEGQELISLEVAEIH